MAMRVKMEIGCGGRTRIENNRSHQPMPEQRSPVIRSRTERPLVEQAVVASGERVVHHYLDAGSRQPSELIEITERVEKRRVPTVAAAGGVRRLRQPHRLARLECIAQGPV